MSLTRYGIDQSSSPPFASAVEADGWLYVSGQVSTSDGQVVPGGIVPEARQAIENLVGILGQAGYGVEHVVRVGVWLNDPRDFSIFNKVFREYFGATLPARACVQATMMIDCKLEIDCIAFKSK